MHIQYKKVKLVNVQSEHYGHFLGMQQNNHCLRIRSIAVIYQLIIFKSVFSTKLGYVNLTLTTVIQKSYLCSYFICTAVVNIDDLLKLYQYLVIYQLTCKALKLEWKIQS